MIRDESALASPQEANPKEEPAPSTDDANRATHGGASAVGETHDAASLSSPSLREGFVHKAASRKRGDVSWGPEYSPATAKYVVGSRDSKSHLTKYRHDEVFDFLQGERLGGPVYPCRLREAGANTQRLKEFRKSVRRSFALTESEGELLLMHEVLPGHRAGEGPRSPSHGLKIVPTKAMVKLLVCKEHAEMHYGSMTTDLNKDYVVPNGYLLEVRADVKRQCNLCGDKTNAAAAPSLRSRLGEDGLLPSPVEPGAQTTAAEPSLSHDQQDRDDGGGGGAGGGEGTRRQELHTPQCTTAADGAPPETGRPEQAPASSPSPSSSSSLGPSTTAASCGGAGGVGGAAAKSRENAFRGEGAVPRLSRKRPLPPDPTFVLLDELSVDSVTNAVLGVPHPGLEVQHPEKDRRRAAVVVWHVGHCGDEDGGGSTLLPRLVDRLVRRSAVDEHTRILVLDDATSSGLSRYRRCDSSSSGGGGVFRRGHDQVVKDAVEDAMHAMKVFEDDEVSKTTVEAHMAQAQLLDSAKFIITGVIEVFSDSERAAAPADKISAHLLCRGRSSVVLAREDPSLHSHEDSGRYPRLLTGERVCRVKEARTPCMAHTPDTEWDRFLTDTRPPGRCAPSRGLYPSVETLEALLCRSGATLTKGVVVIASDPFGAWTEACARLRLSCVAFVGAKPTVDVRRQVETMWRKTTTMGGVPR